MQDVVAGDLRRVVARDQRERIQRDRRGADIADVILDGEEIAVVDRDGAAEGQAFAIVVFQRSPGCSATVRRNLPAATSCSGRECARSNPLPEPSRTRRNRGLRCSTASTARSPARSGSTVSRNLHQRQIVDAGALQRDAADQARRVDLDARGGGNRGVAADDGGGLGRLIGGGRSPASSRPAGLCCRAWRPGLAGCVGFASSAWVWVCARCFSICGTL